MNHRTLLMLLGCVGFVFAVGCGSGNDLMQVKGTVTHQGKPVPNLYLTFMPTDPHKQAPSSSTTDATGKFELKVGGQGGIMPGKYIITASDPAALMGGKSSDDPVYKDICKKYAQGTSKYQIEIKESNRNFELMLD